MTLPRACQFITSLCCARSCANFKSYRYIDYRYLNKAGVKPRYAFGHGLSYTNFSISDSTITKVTELSSLPPTRPKKGPVPDYAGPVPEKEEALAPTGFNKIFRYIYSWLQPDEADEAVEHRESRDYNYPAGYSTEQKPGPRAGGGEGGNPALWDVAYTVSVTITNAGSDYPGKAVAQAYVQFPEGNPYDTPIIQLRDFEKTKELAPGDEQTLELKLTRRDLSVWDVEIQDWVVPDVDGRFKIWVGDASDDLHVVCYTDDLECEEGVEGPV